MDWDCMLVLDHCVKGCFYTGQLSVGTSAAGFQVCQVSYVRQVFVQYCCLDGKGRSQKFATVGKPQPEQLGTRRTEAQFGYTSRLPHDGLNYLK